MITKRRNRTARFFFLQIVYTYSYGGMITEMKFSEKPQALIIAESKIIAYLKLQSTFTR
jgi:hypothetical protein